MLILVFFCISELQAQLYNDYIGAGHNSGITVTASSFVGTSSPSKTLDGSGMDSKLFDASRFLAQLFYEWAKSLPKRVVALP